MIGAPLAFYLGEDAFTQTAIDIDFAHHRLALRDPKTVTRPAGAIEVPLTVQDGQRVTPVSVDGAAPVNVELEIGNVIGPLMLTPAYALAHKLLEGHPTSERVVQKPETVVSVDRIRFAGADFDHAPIAIIPDDNLPPAAITGGLGLPLLSKFDRLIVDYAHNRLYGVPNATAARTPMPKDRIGLVLGAAKSGEFAVYFVSRGSPADKAGFKADGTKRTLTAKDFF